MRRAAIIMVSFGLFALGLVATGAAAAGTDPAIVGSWQLTITDPSAPPGEQTSPSLGTFFSDGTILATDLSLSPAAPGVPIERSIRSAGHGAWAETGPNAVALTVIELDTDERGHLIATVTVSANATLDATGDAISGAFAGSSVGPDGQRLRSFAGTLTGTRITVEPIASPSTAVGTVYVAELKGVSGLVAVHVDEPDATGKRVVRAYVCDGQPTDRRGFALWFTGEAGDGELSFTAPKSTDRLTLTLGAGMAGAVAFGDGRTATFEAPVATNGSGIYEVTVAPDGSFIGRSSVGDVLNGTIGESETGNAKVTGSVTTVGQQPLQFQGRSGEGPFAVDSFVAVVRLLDPVPTATAEHPGAYGLMMAGRSGDVRDGEPGPHIIAVLIG